MPGKIRKADQGLITPTTNHSLYRGRWNRAGRMGERPSSDRQGRENAYGGTRRIEWREVLAGEKAFRLTGSWLPSETIDEIRDYLVAIKGP